MSTENLAVSSSSNIPPLLSNSPPPTPHNEKSSQSSLNDDQNTALTANLNDSIHLIEQRTESLPSQSTDISYLPGYEETTPPSDEKNAQQSEWDPFNMSAAAAAAAFQSVTADKSTENDDSDWANFGVTGSTSLAQAADQDNEDEFTDFVDNLGVEKEEDEQQQQEPVTSSSEVVQNASSETAVAAPPVYETSLNLAELVDRLFTDTTFFFKTNSGLDSSSFSSTAQEINENDTWQQLKTYTSINDASLSLKFKWYLSNIEGFYLESLNLERATAINLNRVRIIFNFIKLSFF